MGTNSDSWQLRTYLTIPAETTATFERYSDSAASFVFLHPANTSAYKQLYRAAKAKQKLKLRVITHREPEPESEPEPTSEPVSTLAPSPEPESDTKPVEDKAPKPVTIEDVPEVEPKEAIEPTTETTPAPESSTQESTTGTAASGILDTIPVSEIHSNLPNFIQLWRAYGMPRINLRRGAEGEEVVDLIGSTSGEPLVKSEFNDGLSLNPETMTQCPFASNKAQKLAQLSKLEKYFRKAKESESANDVIAAPEVEEEMNKNETPIIPSCLRRPFTVCCNSCDRAVPDAHFHCSTCDDGDFDLCQDCVDQGITCYGEGHWLIRRTIKDGQINYSTTQVVPKPPKSPTNKEVQTPSVSLPIRTADFPIVLGAVTVGTPINERTCNCCVQDFPGYNFLHCTTCDDYDLCKGCFQKDKHGHHPGHGFVPVVPGATLDHSISSRLAPGRNAAHNAICDGCDQYIRGVRHKCLDCPDWDYCSECAKNADFVHPNHRFVAIYDPLVDRTVRSAARSTHHGICCDGPLCTASRCGSKYIVGTRYKCAVCHDTDFCANCEACPTNTHNKTHPLIKFKTPVRHVSVTTTGEHEDGQRLPQMGDRASQSSVTLSTPSAHENIFATPVQTVVDVEPTEQDLPKPKQEEVVVKKEEVEIDVVASAEKQVTPAGLVAVFLRDTVADGTVFPPNHTFEQVWVLRNLGNTPWPAGCSVKFVGGDYMGAVDPTHPAGVHELVSASESTTCYNELQPGQEFPFTVLMRTPDRDGKVISYWRLTTPDGVKFGHKLWCDVTVQTPVPKIVKVQSRREREELDIPAATPEMTESQMIIPKLVHESPSSSMLGGNARSEVEAKTEADTLVPSVRDEQEEDDDDFEDCGEDDEWAESDEGFMTDEEYDILDASDEEYLSAQQKFPSKK